MVKDAAWCTQSDVTQAVRRFVPNAELLSEHGGEISYRLPFSAARRFGELLRFLDDQKSALGLGGYGMSPTSMEEVFLRLAEGSRVAADVVVGAMARQNDDDSRDRSSSTTASGAAAAPASSLFVADADATTPDARRRTVARRGAAEARREETTDEAKADRVLVASRAPRPTGATTRPTRVADARVVIAIASATDVDAGKACPDGTRRRACRGAPSSWSGASPSSETTKRSRDWPRLGSGASWPRR